VSECVRFVCAFVYSLVGGAHTLDNWVIASLTGKQVTHNDLHLSTLTGGTLYLSLYIHISICINFSVSLARSLSLSLSRARSLSFSRNKIGGVLYSYTNKGVRACTHTRTHRLAVQICGRSPLKALQAPLLSPCRCTHFFSSGRRKTSSARANFGSVLL
jgi:hypothetical protein